jgi:hypothetical protein
MYMYYYYAPNGSNTSILPKSPNAESTYRKDSEPILLNTARSDYSEEQSSSIKRTCSIYCVYSIQNECLNSTASADSFNNSPMEQFVSRTRSDFHNGVRIVRNTCGGSKSYAERRERASRNSNGDPNPTVGSDPKWKRRSATGLSAATVGGEIGTFPRTLRVRTDATSRIVSVRGGVAG